MPPIHDHPVLDWNVVTSLKELGGDEDPQLFRDLVELFTVDASANVDRLADAIARKDGDGLSRVAHAMKSSSANLGAVRMSVLCLELEKLGREGKLETADSLVREVREQFAEVCSALRAHGG